jgi:FAD/FMN-containing dehydrogenase
VVIKKKLSEIVGPGNFFDDPKVLKTYSKDESIVSGTVPNYVVKPKNAGEIGKIIELANEHMMPVVPVSSQVHFNGASLPKMGGIVVDMSKMNKILEIDDYNRRTRLEAGATWDKVTSALAKKGMRMIMPLAPHASRSVVTDTLEREVLTNMVYDYGEPLQSLEVVWPNGEIFRMGSASVTGYPDSHSKGGNPAGPGIDFYRFVQGAQGTFGIVTWANIKIEWTPKLDKVLFAPVHDLDYANEFLYRLLRLRVGQECVFLNAVDMASLIAEDMSRDFEKLRDTLPPWTLVMVISGLQRRPEGKIAYEENILNDVFKSGFPDMHLTDSLPGFPGLDKKVLPILRNPWPKGETYWKNRYKGACQSLFFITRPVSASKFITVMEEIAAMFDYAASDIGCYVQPIEHNRACQVEFNFFYDPSSEIEKNTVKEMYDNAAKILMDEGAFFTRPYGKLADLVYDKATTYTMALKQLKDIFDPNNIMNPGNLCF